MKNLTKIIIVSSRLEFLVWGSTCSFHVSLCGILMDFGCGPVEYLSGSKLAMKSIWSVVVPPPLNMGSFTAELPN